MKLTTLLVLVASVFAKTQQPTYDPGDQQIIDLYPPFALDPSYSNSQSVSSTPSPSLTSTSSYSQMPSRSKTSTLSRSRTRTRSQSRSRTRFGYPTKRVLGTRVPLENGIIRH